MKCKCKGCDRRTTTCHSTCQDYIDWKAWRDEINKKRSEEPHSPLSYEQTRRWWKNMKRGK